MQPPQSMIVQTAGRTAVSNYILAIFIIAVFLSAIQERADQKVKEIDQSDQQYQCTDYSCHPSQTYKHLSPAPGRLI